MPEQIRLKAILAKEETTYGTDAAPSTGSDEVRVEENFWNSLTIDHREDNLREQSGFTFGRSSCSESTQAVAELDIVHALRGVDTAFASDNLPPADPLLAACGFEETVDTSADNETVTYTLDSSALSSATIHAYSANKLYKITGVIGNVTFDFSPGTVLMARFSLQGIIDPENDISETGLPSGLTFPSTCSPVVQSAGFTLNGQDPDDFQSLEIDAGVEIAERPGGNAGDAHAGFWYSDWSPTLSSTFETMAQSTLDPYSARDTGTNWDGDIGSLGSVQYNTWDFSWSNLRLTGVNHSDINGLAQWDIEGQLQNSDAGTEDAFDIVVS